MNTIACLSADAALLRVALHGAVHSVFQRAVNIETASGELVTLAVRASGNAPATAVLDTRDFLAAGLRAGQPVQATGAMLRVHTMEVSFTQSQPWDPWLPSWEIGEEVDTRLDTAQRTLAQLEPSEPAVLRSAGKVTQALHAGDFGTAWLQAQALIGLGPGLTPSGDDLLLGLVAALNMRGHPLRAALPGAQALVRWARGRTHPISHAALQHAVHGRVRESVAALIAWIMADGRGDAQALGRVLEIGSSSGAEIARGVLLGVRLGGGKAQR